MSQVKALSDVVSIKEVRSNLLASINDKSNAIIAKKSRSQSSSSEELAVETIECIMCHAKPATIKFQLCGHQITCEKCCRHPMRCIMDTCRQPITAKITPSGTDLVKERRFQQAGTCPVCLDREETVMFLSCTHGTCNECARTLDKCPMCRTTIELSLSDVIDSLEDLKKMIKIRKALREQKLQSQVALQQ